MFPSYRTNTTPGTLNATRNPIPGFASIVNNYEDVSDNPLPGYATIALEHERLETPQTCTSLSEFSHGFFKQGNTIFKTEWQNHKVLKEMFPTRHFFEPKSSHLGRQVCGVMVFAGALILSAAVIAGSSYELYVKHNPLFTPRDDLSIDGERFLEATNWFVKGLPIAYSVGIAAAWLGRPKEGMIGALAYTFSVVVAVGVVVICIVCCGDNNGSSSCADTGSSSSGTDTNGCFSHHHHSDLSDTFRLIDATFYYDYPFSRQSLILDIINAHYSSNNYSTYQRDVQFMSSRNRLPVGSTVVTQPLLLEEGYNPESLFAVKVNLVSMALEFLANGFEREHVSSMTSLTHEQVKQLSFIDLNSLSGMPVAPVEKKNFIREVAQCLVHKSERRPYYQLSGARYLLTQQKFDGLPNLNF